MIRVTLSVSFITGRHMGNLRGWVTHVRNQLQKLDANFKFSPEPRANLQFSPEPQPAQNSWSRSLSIDVCNGWLRIRGRYWFLQMSRSFIICKMRRSILNLQNNEAKCWNFQNMGVSFHIVMMRRRVWWLNIRLDSDIYKMSGSISKYLKPTHIWNWFLGGGRGFTLSPGFSPPSRQCNTSAPFCR